MNILYYCDEYPPTRNGGIGTVVKLVAEAMAKRGHRVFVAGKYWDGDGRQSVEHTNGVTVMRWNKGSYDTPSIRLCNLMGNRQRKAQLIYSRTHRLLESLIGKYNIDLVEMPDYVDDFIHYDGLKPSSFSVPMVMRVHGSASFLFRYFQGVENEGKKAQDRAYFQTADAICTVSGFSKRYVEENLCSDQLIEVIYNPIEDGMFDNTTMSADSRTILFLGKVVETKGAFNLIKAFNLVAESHPDIRLRLIGGGDLERAKCLVNSRFVDRVDFVGFMPHDEVIGEIDSASFCVLPSFFENFSMAALEVLARKRALVYTNRASGAELIDDGENGFLVDPDNVGMIAEKMELLLSDANLRHRLAENGYDMCRSRFSTETIIPQMEQYYQSIIEKCRK